MQFSLLSSVSRSQSRTHSLRCADHGGCQVLSALQSEGRESGWMFTHAMSSLCVPVVLALWRALLLYALPWLRRRATQVVQPFLRLHRHSLPAAHHRAHSSAGHCLSLAPGSDERLAEEPWQAVSARQVCAAGAGLAVAGSRPASARPAVSRRGSGSDGGSRSLFARKPSSAESTGQAGRVLDTADPHNRPATIPCPSARRTANGRADAETAPKTSASLCPSPQSVPGKPSSPLVSSPLHTLLLRV